MQSLTECGEFQWLEYQILAIIIPLLIPIAYLTLAKRKVLGYMHRKGPNVVGVYGLLQPIADGVKLFTKEMIIPNHANIFNKAATIQAAIDNLDNIENGPFVDAGEITSHFEAAIQILLIQTSLKL